MGKNILSFLWKQKIFIPTIVAGVFIGASLYSYEKPKLEAPETVVAAETTENDANTADEESTAEGSFDLEDGVYTGNGTGYGGTITVQVTIKDKQIVAIDIVSASGETASFFNRAKAVIDSMIKNQSMDVDTVSGATYSSRGIIEAVKNALTGEVSTSSTAAGASAKGSAGSVGTVDEDQDYKDGTYTGSAQGFGGTITVSVTVKDKKIKSIKVLSASGETASYFSRAKKLLNNIIKKQSTNVDTVSGATYSSNGLIKAVRNALSKAVDKSSNKESKSEKTAASGKFPYADGVYYGTGKGYGGNLTVAIIIRDKTLKSAVITESNETDSYLSRAKSILDTVITKQSTKVDTVSGATKSSNGIITAINNALDNAKNGKNGLPDTSDSSSTVTDPTEGTTYYNGTYKGEANVVPDEYADFSETYAVKVRIKVENDKITKIVKMTNTSRQSSNKTYIKLARDGVNSLIASKDGKLENIDITSGSDYDAISGATYTAESILQACENALAQAKIED